MSSGTHRRIYELLCYFKDRGFVIDLLSINGFTNKWEKEDLEKQDFFESIIVCDWKPSFRDRWERERAGKAGRLPDFSFYSLRKKFRTMLESKSYSFVLVSYVYWASLTDEVNKDIVKVIDLHDFITLNNYIATGRKKFRYGGMFEDEICAITKFNYALSISAEETLMLNPFCDQVRFVNVPVSLPQRTCTEGDYMFDLLFIGSENSFNRDGMAWFMEKVYPLIPSSVRIGIVGKVCNFLQKKDNIKYLQHVSDLDEIYCKSKIVFCPLRGGTGLKIKVVEALSYGRPVITTSWGLAGILQKNNNGSYVADSEGEFAEAIEKLLNDELEYKKIKGEAEEFFRLHFSPDIVYRNLDTIFLK